MECMGSLEHTQCDLTLQEAFMWGLPHEGFLQNEVTFDVFKRLRCWMWVDDA
jgi:hypothetical protein